MKIKAEYLWQDGTEGLPQTRGKGKMITLDKVPEKGLDGLANAFESEKGKINGWGFDGSSTKQAEGASSDCVLQPVRWYKDPIRGGDNIIVLNEVYDIDQTPHKSNTRRKLADLVKKYEDQKFLFGIEQEYTLMEKDGKTPIGFRNGEVKDQGPFYCGAGADKIFGRDIAEEHWDLCLEAGIDYYGQNAEVMPGQWEYQIGTSDALKVGDDLVVARYLMDRLGEKYGYVISLDCKPKENLNGAGAHTNFSTERMREEGFFDELFETFGKNLEAHIEVYGEDVKKRLMGEYETAKWDQFSYGVSDRGASIRIPWQVDLAGKGYLEDRRPGANVNPYVHLAKIIETTMEAYQLKESLVPA